MAKQAATAKGAATTTKASAPATVDAYLQALKHPLAPVLAALRQAILKADPSR